MRLAEASAGYGPLLRNRPFALIVLAYGINTFGNWITVVAALALATFKWHASPLELGGMVSVFLAPAAIASPFAGWLADRFERRHVLLAANLIAGPIVLAMPFAASIWQAYLILAVLRVASSVNQPVMSALVPSLVHPDQVAAANGVLLQPAHLTRAVSPLLAGLIVGGLGASAAFVIDAATFFCAAAIVGLLLSKADETATSATSRGGADPSPGPSFSAVQPLVPLCVIALAASFCFGALESVAPLYVRDLLNLDVAVYGAVISAIGVGAMIGGMVPSVQAESGRPLLYGTLAMAGGFVLIAAAHSFWTLLIGSWIAGFGSGYVLTSGQTLIHLSVSQKSHATVLGVLAAILNVGALTGIFTASLLASTTGISVTLWLIAALLAVSLSAAPWKLRGVRASRSFQTTSTR